ncbi:hypothetical protein [Beggiatoa leptomitoformis]|uniref:Uncharacterized protein n=1 Tax=Beggiatoa leptomitoformis TaxID=288004 RepID=A0A2N9YFH0_9GAMM|nr:hypothetical protein [Beggiatoa leptomitoformis]ALG68454.1 hypothetical protein AL038_13045 [Beggiatoa leptomitoformis]AUI69213.1 hypothetical protein BLE401_11225 [Beggiatoa leptomitoformis]
MTTPYIQLDTNMPRRLFVPLDKIKGDKVEQLIEKVLTCNQVFIYWQQENVKEWKSIAISPIDEGFGYRLNNSLWENSFQIIQIDNKGYVQNLPTSNKDNVTTHLDIAFNLSTTGNECGLYLSWNPKGVTSKVHGLYLVNNINQIEQPVKQDLCGKQYAVLAIPRIAFFPLENDKEPPKTPPDDGALNVFKGLFGIDERWQFRLKKPFLVLNKSVKPDANSRAFFLALDFGTTASTIACLPEQGIDAEDKPIFTPLHHLCSWTHTTLLPLLNEKMKPNGQISSRSFTWGQENDAIDGLFSPVPRHVRAKRFQLATEDNDKREATPGIIYVDDQNEFDELVTTHHECLIGFEAESFLTKKSSSNQINPKNFVFAPKRLIGTDANSSRVQEMLEGFKKVYKQQHPVEVYLQEFLDETLNKAILSGALKSRLSSLCYSYPVTWTKLQRQSLEVLLKSALNKSFFHEFLKTQQVSDEMSPLFCLDEASAAFLGLILKRFQGLEGSDLLRTFSPFEPDIEKACQYPKTMQVLVIDCGGGTTDMVLLSITDAGDKSNTPVVAKIYKHFAIDKGGIEVTRRIAEHLKSLLRYSETLSDEYLRTNLFDEKIKDSFLGDTSEPLELYRWRFCLNLYEQSELIKLALSQTDSTTINWADVVKNLSLPDFNSQTLQPTIEKASLQKWVSETYQHLINQLKLWFAEENQPALDCLLLSGRSSQLAGFREAIINAIPEEKRPLAIDFAEVGNYALEPRNDENQHEEFTAKSLVCKGLALNYWNTKAAFGKRPLECEPIDETRRTRAIGVLAENTSLRPQDHFDPEIELLIDADNQPIELEKEYLLTLDKATAKGFYLGINFGGKIKEGMILSEYPDPPQPFLRIDIDGGIKENFEKLIFYFQQVASTEIKLSKIEMYKKEGESNPIIKENIAMKPYEDTEVALGSALKVHLQIEDFRMTGRIHSLDADE